MEIKNGFANAVTGIRRGMDGLDRDAAEIASASKGDGANITSSLVDSKINKLQVEANVSVRRAVKDRVASINNPS